MANAASDAFPFADLTLARRIERAEANGCVGYIESAARVFPERGACWIEVAGAKALFDAPDSPVTQTFGLGILQPIAPTELDTIEAFFHDRSAPVFHEVSPLADPTALSLLNERGYQPFEFTSVMVRPIRGDLKLGRPLNPRMRARLIDESERDLWVETSARGWSETPGLGDFFRVLGKITASWVGSYAFLAELDDQPIAAGSMTLSDGVAMLAGASTVPEGRNQGAQLALLDARLRFAAEQGCDLALMGAAPGSGSQRNAERHGFRIAYTRIKWRKR